jgi:undecaprenyl-diphosphatase
VHSSISYLQAVVIGLLQGVTELFPISSLGHSVLVPAWIGHSWSHLVGQENAEESPYLAFIVGLHVATALALLVHYRAQWVRIIGGGWATVSHRKVMTETPDQRLFWLLVVVTLPVGILGLAFEHILRTAFAKPLAAAVFLTVNGVILLAGERLRQRSEVAALADRAGTTEEGGRRLDTLDLKEGFLVGIGQSLALLAGISRSGVTMVAGLVRGLDHEDAARFSFLAATPVILAAGVYKVGDLVGSNGNGIRGQVLVGSICAFCAAYVAVRFLERFFQTRTLLPFAVYSLVVGGASVIRFGLF